MTRTDAENEDFQAKAAQLHKEVCKLEVLTIMVDLSYSNLLPLLDNLTVAAKAIENPKKSVEAIGFIAKVIVMLSKAEPIEQLFKEQEHQTKQLEFALNA